MFTRVDKQKTSLLQSARIWIYHGSSLPRPQRSYLFYAKGTLLFGSIYTRTDLIFHHLTRPCDLAKKDRDDVEIYLILVPHMQCPQPYKQERGKLKEQEEKGRKEVRKRRMRRLNSPGKKLPLQWYGDILCYTVMMDHRREGIRKVLCKLSKQPSHALMVRESECHVLVPRHQWALLFVFLPITLGWILSDPGPWEKKSSRNSMSLTNSHMPASSAKGAGMWHVFPQILHRPGCWRDIFKLPFV